MIRKRPDDPMTRTDRRGGQVEKAAPRLSVVIPAFQAAGVVLDAVKSVLDQSVAGVEVVVVDDGSEDDLIGALASLRADERVRVVRQERAGVSVARNRGVQESRGTLLMFVDADDRLAPDSLGAFLEFAIESESDVVISDFWLSRNGSSELVAAINSEQRLFREPDRAVLQRLTLARVGFQNRPNVGLLGAPWAKIYSRRFLELRIAREALFLPGLSRGQDVLFNTEVFGEVSRVGYWPSATYVYSVSGASSSHRPAQDFGAKVTVLEASVQHLITAKGWEHLRPAVAKMVVTLFEESLLRLGPGVTAAKVREMRSRPPVPRALVESRLRDFSTAGKVKLLAFRAGPLSGALLMRALGRVRRR